MSTTTLTLTDFLLARIADDEARTRLPELGSPAEVMLPSITGYVLVDPARVLAECEAKRRTLEVAQLFGCAKAVARYLALPYADHPDYCEEWKP